MHEKNESGKMYNGSDVGLRRKWIISSGKKGVIKNKNFNIMGVTTHEKSINASPRIILQQNYRLGSQTGIFVIQC